MRRHDADLDRDDVGDGNAAVHDFLQRLRRRHGLARRAPRLERDLAQRDALAQSVRERGDVGGDAIDVAKEAVFE